MTNQRLLNEYCEHLARRALSVVAARLPLEDKKAAFIEFARGFRELLLGYELERERMAKRLGTTDEHKRNGGSTEKQEEVPP